MTVTRTSKESGIVLTRDQVEAKDAIISFCKKGGAVITMGGFAGTGKTTTIAETVKALGNDRKSIAFCAFTGRAASVMRGKLEAVGVIELGDYCGTIHGLIYKPVVKHGQIVKWKRVDDIEQDLIVVDEASMVNSKIYRDLASYGVPIVAVGDHGQLPPIEGNFNLMESPDLKLETIHRQAAGNPIVKLSMMARNGDTIPFGAHGQFVVKTRQAGILDRIKDVDGSLFLCGYNNTRVRVNSAIRRRLGHDGPVPLKGEKVICLKNNHEVGIYNGVTGRVSKWKKDGEHWLKLHVDMDDGVEFAGRVFRHQFGAARTLREYDGMEQKEMGDLFDFGYCLTVWKAQGSESNQVLFFEERMPHMSDDDWRRFLYTGITRAKEKLVLASE